MWSARPVAPSALALLLLLAGTRAGAQGVVLDLEQLRTPTVPAFVLMDVSPEAVERPGTYRALSASLLKAGQSGDVLDNYALQVAPYWLRSRPALTLDKFRNAGTEQIFLQTLSFSFATSKFEDEAAHDAPARSGTRIGGGIRFQLADGTVPKSVTDLEVVLKGKQQQCVLLPDTGPGETTEQCIERLKLGETAREIQRLAASREGFVLEVAGAVTGEFPDSSFDAGKRRRLGLWVTPSWRFTGSPLEVIGVGRYFHDSGSSEGEDNVDVGGRLFWDGGFASFSGEALWRWSDGSNGSERDFRTALIAEVNLSDDIYATYSLGRGLSGAGADDGRLVSTFSVNVGAGRTPLIRIP